MHVLAEETLPPTNIHSGNPVADGQAVMFPSTHTTFTPYASATIILPNLYA